MRYIFFMLLSIFFCNCSDSKKEKAQITTMVENLITAQEEKEFLEEIYDSDQFVREEWDNATATYGRDSKEEKKAISTMMETDNFNLRKISSYLDTYGHPTIVKHGKKACLAPWIVIHHTNNKTARTDFFPFLYQAYVNKDLQPGRFSLYLNRFHTLQFGKLLSLPNPYREEDLIDSLLVKLRSKVSLSY